MVETLDEILRKALEYKGSDVFVVPGSQIMTKASGKMIPITQDRALPNDIAILVDRAYELAGRTRETLHEEGDDDFSFAVRDLSRFRCNTYRQRGSLAMTCRVVAFGIPDPQDCHIPDVVMRLADFRSGDSLWETELSFPAELVSGLWFSPDDGLLLVPYGNTRCALFRVSDGTLLNDLAFETEAESSPVSMQLDADGRLYVYNAGPPAAQSDSLVLDAETGELLGRIPGLVFVNFRTRKLYIRDSQNRYTSLFPLFSLEELVSMAEDPD